MENLINMDWEEFIRLQTSFQAFNTDIIVIEIDGSKQGDPEILNDISFREDALSINLICKGRMDAIIDFFPYEIRENTLLDIVEQHVVQSIRVSPDFRGYAIIISHSFLSACLGNNQTIPTDVIVSKRTKPTQVINTQDVQLLEGYIRKLMDYIGQKDHIFQRSMVMNQFSIFMMEMGNLMYHKNKHNLTSVELSRKEKLISRFMVLLNHHAREQHEVTFYARELCITPEYLTRILKQATGRTVNGWIANALMTEAKILLRDPALSIQQIADMLNFADQSSFGKFFKKHKGKSPLEYRKKVLRVNR